MKRNNTLSHTVWDCKYHIVWIPKFRRKVLYYKLRTYLGKIFHELAQQRECEIIKIGKPPALLGDSQSLTFRAMKKTSILEPFKVSGKEVISGSSKPKPFNMGMQLSCGMDTQIQKEENIQGNTDRFGNCSA